MLSYCKRSAAILFFSHQISVLLNLRVQQIVSVYDNQICVFREICEKPIASEAPQSFVSILSEVEGLCYSWPTMLQASAQQSSFLSSLCFSVSLCLCGSFIASAAHNQILHQSSPILPSIASATASSENRCTYANAFLPITFAVCRSVNASID